MKAQQRQDISNRLRSARRVVVKVGSSSLVHEGGKLNLRAIDLLVRQLADLQNSGRQVLLVSSGAVAAGLGKLSLAAKPDDIAKKQALAAIGQGILMQIYEKFFSEYGVNVAQVLLTKEDIAHRDRYLNARNTFHALLEYGVVPIINENDSTSTAEIKVGDNDTLAALVAGLAEADLLILLSDIDGLYTANPRLDPTARKLEVVEEITPEIEAMGGEEGSSLGTGGMATKLQAAKIVCSSGLPMALADCSIPEVLLKLCGGENCGTIFLPRDKHLMGKKGWLAYGATACGRVLVDAGAARALVEGGSSLLPRGVVGVRGSFTKGDIVAVCTESEPKHEIAKGFVNYGSSEIEVIKGCHSNQIAELLGEPTDGMEYSEEIIHRDYMSIK